MSQKFITAVQKYLKKNDSEKSKKILIELKKLNSVTSKNITPLKSPTCSHLEIALKNIPKDLSPFDTITKSITKKLIWHEAERGVPDQFKGGYAFTEIIGERGLKFSDSIRLGLFLQKPNVNYPLHAHDAEELYFVLSGSSDWQINQEKFSVGPGSIIHHQTCENHAMITSSSPLFAMWVWTGKINGRYWFVDQIVTDCPNDF